MVKRKSPQLRCPTCTPKVYPETELRAALIIRLVLGRRVKADLGGKIGNNPTIRVAWQRWLKFRVHLKARARKGLEWGGGAHMPDVSPKCSVGDWDGREIFGELAPDGSRGGRPPTGLRCTSLLRCPSQGEG